MLKVTLFFLTTITCILQPNQIFCMNYKNLEHCICLSEDTYPSLHGPAYDGCIPCCTKGLEMGMDPNQTSVSNITPLHFAAYQGHAKILDLFLSNGGDLFKPDSNGDTTLHWAVEGGEKPVINFIFNWLRHKAILVSREIGYHNKFSSIISLCPQSFKKKIFTFMLIKKRLKLNIPSTVLYKIMIECYNPLLNSIIFDRNPKKTILKKINKLIKQENYKKQIALDVAQEFRRNDIEELLNSFTKKSRKSDEKTEF